VIAVDTNVIVAAISPWHEFHDVARAACADDTRVPANWQWVGWRSKESSEAVPTTG